MCLVCSIPPFSLSARSQRIKNLCSGYSYCITTLDHIYVWHGIGSIPTERSAALDYGKGMATSGTMVVELVEGEGDVNDEMFWMIMGDPDSYAKADYWRWRNISVPSEPRCWSVELSNKDAPVGETGLTFLVLPLTLS